MKNSVFTLTLLFSTLTFLCLMGCGGGKQTITSTPPPDVKSGSTLDLPDWFLSPPKDPGYLFTATDATSPVLHIAISSAEQRGRAAIVLKLQQLTQTTANDFIAQAGVTDPDIRSTFDAQSKSIAEELVQLLGRKELEVREEKSLYHAYVLMELPVGAEKEKLLQNIKEDKHLYDLFRSKQAFEQLNKDVEEYRKFKQQQGVQ